MPYWYKSWSKWGKWGRPVRKRRGFPPKGAHCLSSLKLSQVVLYPFPCWCLQHFSYCSPSAWFSRESGSEFWQLQLWPEGPASLVLAPSTSASHLIGDFGFFSAPLCFPENMEHRLTGRINFHCSCNSQLISLELYSLPFTTSTMLFQKFNFRITETFRCIFSILSLIIKTWVWDENSRLEVLSFHHSLHRPAGVRTRKEWHSDFLPLQGTPVAIWYMLDTILKGT